jgi:demethylmenaquinone methyltransferase / 2-methoxy-6-polyprenyl-1,4-benzoquinol methylase
MFDSLVDRYDVVNDLLSLGMVRGWRRAAARAIGVPCGRLVLDMGCGTGRLTEQLAERNRVVGVDVSWAMLLAARSRLAFTDRVMLVQGSAFRLPFAEASFGGAASAFVLRNLHDLPGAFAELARVVAPSGRVALVDITEPRSRLLSRAFRAYFGTAAPALGSLVGRREAYRYLVRSLAQLPPREEVRAMLRAAGFESCSARPLIPGAVTLWTATRAKMTGDLRGRLDG